MSDAPEKIMTVAVNMYQRNRELQGRIEKLEQRLKDTEFLYHSYFVLATEAGIKPGSRELTEAACKFEAVLKGANNE